MEGTELLKSPRVSPSKDVCHSAKLDESSNNLEDKKTCFSGLEKLIKNSDAVIFSDDSEKVFHEEGLEAFIENEVTATTALKEGPFKSFLVELNDIQNDFDINDCPIRTALVTARSAPSDKRVIKTLREWGVRIDESLFLGGMSKQEFLKSFQVFLDLKYGDDGSP